MITSLITQIENGEIVLPAIQRDFVWNENRITMMFDSIMRGYPLGIVLLWETYLDIKYREFAKNSDEDSKHIFMDNDSNSRIKLVLDGQQRLQSLYISLNGSLNNKRIYFDLLSGERSDDFREVFYVFKFLTKNQAIEQNKQAIENRKNNEQEDEGEKYSLFISVFKILESNPESRLDMRNAFQKKYELTSDETLRLELNMSKLIHSLTNEPNILKVSTIDENKSKESKDRKSESDILEAFVRINRQGITLSRSDLIFSMLKLNWKESSEELPAFIKEINEGNNLNIDIDFVIRSLFAVSNLGSKFDVDLLRKSSNVQKVKDNYLKTCNSIRSLVDFMQDELNILNSAVIGSYLNLMPIVYYLSNTPDNLVPNSEILRVKKALAIFGYTRPFSRYGDSRIGRFIRDELKPLSDENEFIFPLESAVWWSNYWEGYYEFDTKLLQRNRHLTLHLLQGKQGTKVKYIKNSPELDHIFPKSTLSEKGYDWSEINTYGNFWILAKTKNQNKSNKHPKEYFSDVEDSVLSKSFIDRELLDFRKYKSFIKWREIEILNKIKKNLHLKDAEIDYSTMWPSDDQE